jgi:CheY-like chemotaxis protein
MSVVSPSAPVLLVDDDSSVRESLTEVLEAEGHRVIAAENGLRALALLRGGVRPSVVLLDVMMPVMDGWDFRLQQLRDPELLLIPVVVVTAAGFSSESIRRQFGAVCYLQKPIDVERLLGIVKSAAAPADA